MGAQAQIEKMFRERRRLKTGEILRSVLTSDHRKIICRLREKFEREGLTIVNLTEGTGDLGEYVLVSKEKQMSLF